jgi:prevent-host-death family protein
MAKIERKGAEEARNQLPKLIEAAEAGHATVITRRGEPVAALVPVDAYTAYRQESLLPIAVTGRGLWGRNSSRRLRRIRDEWNR